jgi:hypothetical protein
MRGGNNNDTNVSGDDISMSAGFSGRDSKDGRRVVFSRPPDRAIPDLPP